VITQKLAGEPLKPGPHAIQGIGAGFIPGNLDLSLVDRVERVEDAEALEMTRRLAREEGILAGISCGAAVAGRCRLAHSGEFPGETIVVLLLTPVSATCRPRCSRTCEGAHPAGHDTPLV
jgi:cysteine synthase A